MLDDALDRRFAEFRATRDPAALADVFDATAPTLLRIANHLARDSAEAEDIVQATFLSAMERAAQYDPTRPLIPWLIGILQHQAADARRRAQRCLDVTRLPRESTRDAVDEAAAREFFAELASALDALPDRDRHLLSAHIDGWSSPAIGRRYGMSEGAVRVRIHRGLRRLRRALPPGFLAGALFVTVDPRGFGAVRASVTGAGGWSTATALSALVGGSSIVKALIAAGVIVALVVTTWIRLDVDRPAPNMPTAASPAAAHDTDATWSDDVDLGAATSSLDAGPIDATRVPETVTIPSISGRVRSDPELAPIAGAQVRGIDDHGVVAFETTSASDGSFAVPSSFVVDGRLVGFVVAEATGYARGRDATFSDTNGIDDVPVADIRLVRASTIEGVVRTERGEALAGVRVEVFDELGPWLRRASCVTDALGAYAVTGFRPSPTRPQTLRVVDAQGRCRAVDEVPVSLAVVRHDVTVRDGAALDVTVVDANDRSPIAGATVVVLGVIGATPIALELDDVPVSSIASTANTGVARITDLFGAAVDVIAIGERHAWAAARVELRDAVGRIELVLPRAARVAGIVIGPDGRAASDLPLRIETDVPDPSRFDLDAPIARVRRLRFSDRDHHPFATSTTSSASGRFTLDRIATRTSAHIVLGTSAFGSLRQEFGPFPLAPGDERLDLEIHVRWPRRIEFRVYDEHGVQRTTGVTIGSRPLAAWTSVADEHGTYVLELPPGEPSPLAVGAIGYRSQFVDAAALASGRVDVRLVRGSTLEGQVVDPEGRGREGVTVVAATAATASSIERSLATWFPDFATTWSATTDGTGRFVLSGIPSTRVDLAIFAPDVGSTTHTDVASDAQGLTIPLADDSP